MASFVLSPAFALAKDNDKDKGNKGENEKKEQSRNDRDDDRRDRSCFKAFGHLIAPGWFKKNGQASTTDDYCTFPFGIKHHFHGDHATTTPIVRVDTVAPVISSIVSVTSTTSVRVAWKTNENSNSRVYYSTSSAIDASSTPFVETTTLLKNHVVTVPNLAASTTHYFMVQSSDSSGNISRSAVFPATTGTVSPVVDTTAPVITNAVAVVGTTTVQLSWNTNESATTKAYYSTTTPVDVAVSSTPFTENVSLVSVHGLTVSNLATSTTYYMVLESKDSSGNAGRAAQFTFTTSAGI